MGEYGVKYEDIKVYGIGLEWSIVYRIFNLGF